ncbi:MAG: hypothetical protein Q4D25_08565 [Bacteroidales bacterium]|nr:hypothetical protein [Bacteroidales bacterium]
MTQQEVNRLIDKYMEGKTSLEEERQLAIEVNRPDAPAEWKIVAEMLGELTWGEALYDEEMAARKRVRLHRYIGWSVAACLTLWFVLGKFSAPTPQQDMIPQIVQQPTQMVKPEVPEEKEVPPVVTSTSLAVEQVAYNPPAKRVKKHRRPARPAVEVVEQEELPVLPEVSEEELAQVERDFQMWQLKQAFLVEQVELDAATAALNKKYEAYLAEARNSIEI